MNTIRILVVDDNDELRLCMIEYLKKQQDIMIAGEASNGMEAMKHVHGNQVDVMLLDMIMPNMDGLACLPSCSAFRRKAGRRSLPLQPSDVMILFAVQWIWAYPTT